MQDLELHINAEELKKKLNLQDGKDGYTPIKGKDYFDGKTPILGVDFEIPTKEEVINAIKPFIPPPVKGDNGSPDTAEQVRDKLTSLPIGERLPYAAIDGTPDIEQIIRVTRQSSKTVSLVELDDVNLTGLTQTNGKYNLGSGGSGGVQSVVAGTNVTVDNTDPANPIVSATGSGAAWGTITGTLSSQTDLQTALDAKASKSFVIAMALALG